MGREEERALLEGLVAGVAGGRGGVVWVEGEPGVGKSTLLTAGLAGAQDLGCQLAWGTADELTQRSALRVMLDCLRVKPGSSDPARREIADLLSGRRAAGGSADPVAMATELLLALVDRLCVLAPLVLVVDDVQWADEQSLAVWGRLARSTWQLPLLLVGGARPFPRRAELTALRRLLPAVEAAAVTLPPLPPDAVAAQAAGLVGARSVGPKLATVLTQTAGNPLYVRELVEALAGNGSVRVENGTAELRGSEVGSTLPGSLVAAIEVRLGFVSSATLSVLRVAALLGAVFSVADLGMVLARSAVELTGAVQEAVLAGVLAESGSRLAFRHVLIRQALLESTPIGLRRQLHWQAAEALSNAGVPVPRVAEQLLAALPDAGTAEPAGAPVRWVASWLAGPGSALTYQSPRLALDLFERVLATLPDTDPAYGRLRVGLVELFHRFGRREDAIRLAEQALAAASDPDQIAELSFHLERTLTEIDRWEQARAVLLRALEARPSRDWATQLRAHLAGLDGLLGDTGRAVAAARAALSDAKEAGDPITIGRAAQALAYTCGIVGDTGLALERLVAAEDGLAALGDDSPDTELWFTLLEHRLIALWWLGRTSEVEQAFALLHTAAERTGVPGLMGQGRYRTALFYCRLGRWDVALADLDMAQDLEAGFAAAAKIPRAWIAAHRDDQAMLAANLDLKAIADPDAQGNPWGWEDEVMAYAAHAERHGHPEQALAAYTKLLARGRNKVMSVTTAAEPGVWLPHVIRLALARNQPDTVRRAAEISQTVPADSPLPAHVALVAHCRGLLEADPDLLTTAADTYRALRTPLYMANALEDAAAVLAGRGDLPPARARYGEAARVYTSLGANWDLLRADARLRTLGVRRWHPSLRQRPATGWKALTPTELKITALVAAGNANPDIAAELFLSRRTVESHVAHILAKLDARSRVDIARLAAQHQHA